ncbi:hypothetical protein BT69DRAFT_1320992 [Atractiella rhizophila]|nr:hypothetical protein BT69DRAFT_1320992 [Atractiella rhizophila]
MPTKPLPPKDAERPKKSGLGKSTTTTEQRTGISEVEEPTTGEHVSKPKKKKQKSKIGTVDEEGDVTISVEPAAEIKPMGDAVESAKDLEPTRKKKKKRTKKRAQNEDAANDTVAPSAEGELLKRQRRKAKKSKQVQDVEVTEELTLADEDLSVQIEEPAEPAYEDAKAVGRRAKQKAARLGDQRGVWDISDDEGGVEEEVELEREARKTIEWESITLLGGAREKERTNKIEVEISEDGRFVFHPVASIIHIYSLPDLTPVSVLFPPTSPSSGSQTVLPPASPGEVTSLSLHPQNPLQLLVGYSSGFIFVWDWVDGTVLNVIDVHIVLPIEEQEQKKLKKGKTRWDVLIPRDSLGKLKNQIVFGATEVSTRKSEVQRSFVAIISTSQPLAPYSKGDKGRSSLLFKLGPDCAVKALCHSRSHTVVMTTSSIVVLRPGKKLHFTAHLASPGVGRPSSLSVSRSGDESTVERSLSIAVSDSQGKIHVLNFDIPTYARFSEKISVPSRGLHWHAHACKLAPTFNETSGLLSIGEEAVLVKWPLNPNNFDHREYVPRLGGEGAWIRGSSRVYIGANKDQSTEIVLGLEDGSVIWLADRRVVRRLGGVKLIAKSACPSVPLALHQSTSTLIFPSSNTSALQFFSPSLNSNLYELSVAPTNRVTRRDEDDITETVVEHVAISQEMDLKKETGVRWLATMERWQDREDRFSEEASLKFWKVKGNSFEFRVNTRVDNPHKGPLTSLSFSRPIRLEFASNTDSAPLLLTTAEGGEIKLWALDGNNRSASWRCRASFTHRSLPALGSAFSDDSTLFAVAHGVTVTIWDSVTNALVKSLPTAGVIARNVKFVGKDNLTLVAGGETGALGWDLRTWEPIWTSFDPVTSIIVPSVPSPLFVLLSTDASKQTRTKIKLIRVTSEPSFDIRKFSHPQSIKSALVYSFDPTTYALVLACITTSGDLVMLGEDVKKNMLNVTTQSLSSISTSKPQQRSLFEDLFGAELTATREEMVDVPDAKGWRDLKEKKEREERALQLLETPAHLLPPVTMWWRTLLDASLPNVEDEKEEQAKVEQMEVDEDVPVEEQEKDKERMEVVVERTEEDRKEMDALIKRIVAIQMSKGGKIQV